LSGRYSLEKLWKDFVKITKVFIKLGGPRGSINFEVSGAQKSGGYRSLVSKTISPDYSLSGLGYDLLGSVQLGASGGSPEFFTDSADIRYVKVRKKMRDIQLRITSSTFDTDYTLLGFIVEGTRIPNRAPMAWKG
jgi:hypothetical protein